MANAMITVIDAHSEDLQDKFAGRNPESLFKFQPMVQKVGSAIQGRGGSGSRAQTQDIAEVIFGPATDGSDQLGYMTFPDAEEYLRLRSSENDPDFFTRIREHFGLQPRRRSKLKLSG